MKNQKKKGLKIISLIAMLFLAGVLAAQSISLTDENITDKVDSELFIQSDVTADDIDVETEDGIVTLSGAVDDILTKDRAERIAMAIKGVRGVINQLYVEATGRSDENMRQDIEQALYVDPATDSYEVGVEVSDGMVTLTGEVESMQEKRLCTYVAKGVRGVRSVENDMIVDYDAERSDMEIENEIEAAIFNDIRLYPKMLQVKVEDGQVWLSGSVGSLSEKYLAESYAWVNGVENVLSDGVNLYDWAKNDNLKRENYPYRTDAQIKEAVEAAFIYDPRVYSFNPEVKVNNSVVTLSGVVDNIIAKRAAEEDARNIVGVSHVLNNLKVRLTSIPEAPILEARVEAALERNPKTAEYDLNVSAARGTVYLNGFVDTYFQKDHAEYVAGSINGVQRVVNNISVLDDREYDFHYPYPITPYYPSSYISHGNYYTYPMTDKQIKNNVQSELWWSPFVDRSDIEVRVDQGTVTLTGAVDDWKERSNAIENAYEGGAKDVIDLLIVGEVDDQ